LTYNSQLVVTDRSSRCRERSKCVDDSQFFAGTGRVSSSCQDVTCEACTFITLLCFQSRLLTCTFVPARYSGERYSNKWGSGKQNRL